jgi:hypothetical protein
LIVTHMSARHTWFAGQQRVPMTQGFGHGGQGRVSGTHALPQQWFMPLQVKGEQVAPPSPPLPP